MEGTRVMTRLAAALLVAVTLALGFSAPASAQDLDCGDFGGDQAAAQAYFESGGGSPAFNFNALDRDRDGIACEDGAGSPAAPAPAAAAPAAPTAASVAAVTTATDTGVGPVDGTGQAGLLVALFGLAGVSGLAALRTRRA